MRNIQNNVNLLYLLSCTLNILYFRENMYEIISWENGVFMSQNYKKPRTIFHL